MYGEIFCSTVQGHTSYTWAGEKLKGYPEATSAMKKLFRVPKNKSKGYGTN